MIKITSLRWHHHNKYILGQGSTTSVSTQEKDMGYREFLTIIFNSNISVSNDCFYKESPL